VLSLACRIGRLGKWLRERVVALEFVAVSLELRHKLGVGGLIIDALLLLACFEPLNG
jgi:hypothetical protein